MTLQKLFFSLITILTLDSMHAQEKAMFNGKLYFVYPQTIQGYYSNISFSFSKLEFTNIALPPVIGSVPDGEYLIYNEAYHLKNKVKVNKEIIYDTIPQVYATFTIRNNKKEGNVTFYKMKLKPEVKLVLPYSNDVLHGSVTYFKKESENHYYPYYRHYDIDFAKTENDYDNESEYLYLSGRDKKIKTNGNLIKMNFENGVLNGEFRNYICNKRDTLLKDSFNVIQGMRQGIGVKYTYYRRGKSIRIYSIEKGSFKDGKKEGKWIEWDYYMSYKEKTEFYYQNGISRKHISYLNGDLYSIYMVGRDSVIKYAGSPDYKELVPDINSKDYWSDEDYILIRYNKGEKLKTTFRIDGFVSPGFYKEYSWYGITDTLINGKFFRTVEDRSYRYHIKTVEYFLLDTCSNKIVKPFGYCSRKLWEKRYNRKGKLIYSEESDFYRNNFKYDSGNLIAETPVRSRHMVKSSFFYKPLEYSYTNYYFKNGRYENSSVYYKVGGNKSNGFIIKFIKIPVKGDSIILADTLMLKGKFVYRDDRFFEQGYNPLLYHEKYGISNNEVAELNFNEVLLNYFSVRPFKHQTVFIGREIFTGNLDLRVSYKGNEQDLDAEIQEIETFFGSFLTNIHIEIGRPSSMLRISPYTTVKLPVGLIRAEYEQGVLLGSFYVLDALHRNSEMMRYYKNKLDGDVESQRFDIRNKRWRSKMKSKHANAAEKSLMQFNSGKKEGQWTIHDNLNYYEKARYHFNFRNDKLSGHQYRFSTFREQDYLNYMYFTVNDTLNGTAWHILKNGFPLYKANFVNGRPHGEIIRYFPTDSTSFFKEKYRFKNGYLSGLYEHYRDSNNLKYSIYFSEKDSMFFSVYRQVSQFQYQYHKIGSKYKQIGEEYYINEFNFQARSAEFDFGNGFDFLQMLFKQPYIRKGYYTYYYKSGTVFKKGLMQDYLPQGLWTFYREGNDRLYKTINFKDSILNIEGTDTVFSFGAVTAYYDDGKIMFRGFATDSDTKYTCESEADIPTEEDYYTEFYDTAGKQVLLNGSGMITEYQASGHKLKEGQMLNYKKQGIWIYYNNFGQAEAIGFYEQGKKTGRWLTGDLSGLNLNENVCFMSNEEFLNWINTNGKNLSLTEEFYNNGILVGKNQTEAINRK